MSFIIDKAASGMLRALFASIALCPALAGCASRVPVGGEDRARYLGFLRELATGAIPLDGESDADPARLVHPSSATTREYRKDYRVVWADRRYMSFRCEDYAYLGGAHGFTAITVGTIDRATGRTLTLDDVAEFADREALARELRSAVVAKIGEAALQNEVRPHDNFHLAADGWHFVYNQYDVAAYAEGAIEAVIPRR